MVRLYHDRFGLTRLAASSTMQTMAEYLVGLDQGSTSSKAVLLDRRGRMVTAATAPLKTRRPRRGWTEHDAEDLLESGLSALRQVVRSLGRGGHRVAGLGIACQRSTFLLWDRQTGRPLGPAISWQDLRAEGLTRQWAGHREVIRAKTGLALSPHYAAPKIRWLLKQHRGLRTAADRGRVLCGTVNSFFIWHLTRGRTWATDHTNAARMLLMNLGTLSWDPALLDLFGIPKAMLPPIRPTIDDYGTARLDGWTLPIRASIGDQQAALIGHGLIRREALINYGTGAFVLVPTGRMRKRIPGLLTSVAWSAADRPEYLVEGTVNSAGSAVQWLREVGLLRTDETVDSLCGRLSRDPGRGTLGIPAFAGLGPPHGDSDLRAVFYGIDLKTRRADIVFAVIEGVALLVNEVLTLMDKDRSIRPVRLVASGGMSEVACLLQAQADLSGRPVRRAVSGAATARGAALLAGMGIKWWGTRATGLRPIRGTAAFRPRLTRRDRLKAVERWRRLLAAARGTEP